MVSYLHLFARICGGGPSVPSMLASMFLVGLAGSAVHCGPMCGPLVLGQVSDRLARMPVASLCELSRLRSALMLPYHAGRLLTYAALGALAGSIGLLAISTRLFPAMGLSAAGLLCLAKALFRLSPSMSGLSKPLRVVGFGRALVRMGHSIDRTSGTGTFLLGLLLGFLPCGLIYTALLAASASVSAFRGAALMLAFGAGTIPALVSIGLAGHLTVRKGLAGRAGGLVLLANAVFLLSVAARTWIG